MPKKVNEIQPFYNPEQPANTPSAPPTDVATNNIKKANKKNNYLINYAEGKINTIESFTNREKNLNVKYNNMSNNSGYGRTLNVPKVLPAGVLPGPSYNGAVTIGEPCKGGHCSTQ